MYLVERSVQWCCLWKHGLRSVTWLFHSLTGVGRSFFSSSPIVHILLFCFQKRTCRCHSKKQAQEINLPLVRPDENPSMWKSVECCAWQQCIISLRNLRPSVEAECMWTRFLPQCISAGNVSAGYTSTCLKAEDKGKNSDGIREDW